jgi:hypothetical protein
MGISEVPTPEISINAITHCASGGCPLAGADPATRAGTRLALTLLGSRADILATGHPRAVGYAGLNPFLANTRRASLALPLFPAPLLRQAQGMEYRVYLTNCVVSACADAAMDGSPTFPKREIRVVQMAQGL